MLQTTESSDSDRLEASSDRLEASSDRLEASSDRLEELKAIAAPIREKSKVKPDLMREMILRVCRGVFLTQQQLADILNRSTHTLRTSYLKDMVGKQLLELRYPEKPTHPNQAYRTKE